MSWQDRLNSYLTSGWQRWVLVGLLVLYALLLTYKINGPFIGTSEAFSGMYGIAAWNWLIHGPLALKFALMTPYGAQPVLPEITKTFFLNHPSFFIAPTAFFYWLFGVGEWQTRLSPILFSLLSLVVFWFLIKRVFQTPWLTATSSLLYVLFPMGIFYGRLLTHDPATLFFILLLFLTVIFFEQKRQRKYLVALGVVTFLGGLTDWPFFLATATAWLYIIFRRNYPQRWTAVVISISALALALGVTLIQIGSITQTNPISFLSIIFFNRSAGFDLSLFLLLRLNFDSIGFSEIGLLLATTGIIGYILKNKKDQEKNFFLLLLIAPGILTYLIFHSHATGHQFMGLYFLPPIALFTGWGFSYLRRGWQASIIFFLLAASCFWYASNLFNYQSFALDDFILLRRINSAVPLTTAICMGENAVNTNIKFYLFPHQLDDVPCFQHDYFVLRQPESYQRKNPSFSLLQSFFNNSFSENLRRVSFASASGIKIIKITPLLKEKIEQLFADHDPHGQYAIVARRTQALIDAYSLQPVDCSTNFCLYKK